MGIHVSTAHVYLKSLAECGYVVTNDGTCELSYSFLNMGPTLRQRSRIFQAAREGIEHIAAETDELPTLVLEEDGNAVIPYLERGENALELGMYSGMTTPLHTVAPGKC